MTDSPNDLNISHSATASGASPGLVDGRRMKKVVAANFSLGEPLLHSVFDSAGRLLLRKGAVITMPDQIDKLVARGALIEDYSSPEGDAARVARAVSSEAPPVVKESVFERMSGVVLNLKHIIATALRAPEQIDVPARILRLARTVQELVEEDGDGALAAPYLDYLSPAIVSHLVFGAVLTEVVTGHRGLSAEERQPLVCAALTRDWGQLALQAELERNNGELGDELRGRLHKHPQRGAELLAQAGVSDDVWLTAVRQHHERLDGSGYPAGLGGADISFGGHLLAIVDIYSAMTKPRNHRRQVASAQAALYEMYSQRGGALDGELVGSLIREIGAYPPGSLVRLKCGEIAAVKSPTPKAEGARVFSVFSKSGTVLSSPSPRDTTQAEFEITSTVPFADCKPAAVTIKRIWTGSKP